MLHDERVYSDPLEFRPERFLNKEKQETESNYLPPSDPYTYAFGFGRRSFVSLCIGKPRY